MTQGQNISMAMSEVRSVVVDECPDVHKHAGSYEGM
jgi:hypothetical protein